MALNSKTKIGGEGESNERMMRASATGSAAVRGANSEALREGHIRSQEATQDAQIATSVIGKHFDDKESARRFDEGMDLDAAKAGFERNTKKEGGEDGAKQQDMEAKLRQEQGQPSVGPLDAESQSRLKSQTSQPLEGEPGGTWRPTEERKQNIQREQRRADFQADTERQRAEAYSRQVTASANKAYAAGDMEAYERFTKEAASKANSTQLLADRFVKADVRPEDWADLKKEAMGTEQFDPSLVKDIEAKQVTERVQAFVRARVQYEALTAISRTGAAEGALKIDWTMPQIRQFIDTRNSMNDFAKSNPAMTEIATIRSAEDKMRFVNKLAARMVREGMTMAPAADPTRGMTPGMPGGGGQAVAPQPDPAAGAATGAAAGAMGGRALGRLRS